MLTIFTKTRRIKNWSLYPFSSVKYWFSTEEEADKHIETHYDKQTRDMFIIKFLPGASKDKPSLFIDKPALQTTLETASPEEIQAVEEKNKAEELAIAVKRNDIDLIKEMEIWLGTIDSASSRRTYRNGIDKFLKYCESHNIEPVYFSVKDAVVFVKWLTANGATTPTIRSTISSCKKLFTRLWENHEIPIPSNPFGPKSLLPRKNKRVKLLLVPDQTDLDRFLDYAYAERNLIPYTAIKLIAKHGMRIGAFEKMKARGKKAVTESKGGKHSFVFDDEDITLLKAYPLNELTAERLAGMVNYHLERAYEKGVTKEKYSVHDFRHYFAINFLKKNKDNLSLSSIICKLSKKLGHKSITTTTEVYLESLDKESL